jgi:hypothetical protein
MFFYILIQFNSKVLSLYYKIYLKHEGTLKLEYHVVFKTSIQKDVHESARVYLRTFIRSIPQVIFCMF